MAFLLASLALRGAPVAQEAACAGPPPPDAQAPPEYQNANCLPSYFTAAYQGIQPLAAWPLAASDLAGDDVLRTGIPFAVNACDIDNLVVRCTLQGNNTDEILEVPDSITYTFTATQGTLPAPPLSSVSRRCARSPALGYLGAIQWPPSTTKTGGLSARVLAPNSLRSRAERHRADPDLPEPPPDHLPRLPDAAAAARQGPFRLEVAPTPCRCCRRILPPARAHAAARSSSPGPG